MKGKLKKEDLRIIKTKKYLTSSVWKTLSKHGFGKITVNDLCDEALISRSTFYIYYKDKYDLLQQCLWEIGQKFLDDVGSRSEEEKEDMIGNLLRDNKKIVMNLAADCDTELFYIISDFLACFLDCLIKENPILQRLDKESGYVQKKKIIDGRQKYLYDFCIGGLLDILVWQQQKNFQDDYKSAVIYIYKIIKLIFCNMDISESLAMKPRISASNPIVPASAATS